MSSVIHEIKILINHSTIFKFQYVQGKLGLRKGWFGHAFRHRVTNFEPHFLSPQASELKNFSAVFFGTPWNEITWQLEWGENKEKKRKMEFSRKENDPEFIYIVLLLNGLNHSTVTLLSRSNSWKIYSRMILVLCHCSLMVGLLTTMGMMASLLTISILVGVFSEKSRSLQFSSLFLRPKLFLAMHYAGLNL